MGELETFNCASRFIRKSLTMQFSSVPSVSTTIKLFLRRTLVRN